MKWRSETKGWFRQSKIQKHSGKSYAWMQDTIHLTIYILRSVKQAIWWQWQHNIRIMDLMTIILLYFVCIGRESRPTETNWFLFTISTTNIHSWHEKGLKTKMTMTFEFSYYLWPWTAKPVISRTVIFVAITNNTLYGSKWLIFLLCQISLGY